MQKNGRLSHLWEGRRGGREDHRALQGRGTLLVNTAGPGEMLHSLHSLKHGLFYLKAFTASILHVQRQHDQFPWVDIPGGEF